MNEMKYGSPHQTRRTYRVRRAGRSNGAGRSRRTVVASVAGASVLAVMALAALTSPAGATGASGAPTGGECATGQLCLWEKPQFEGARQVYELSGVPIESCVPLPKDGTAESLANRTGRPVTTYQSEECAETGEFETYPGKGTWTPQSPYLVRAFKVWER